MLWVSLWYVVWVCGVWCECVVCGVGECLVCDVGECMVCDVGMGVVCGVCVCVVCGVCECMVCGVGECVVWVQLRGSGWQDTPEQDTQLAHWTQPIKAVPEVSPTSTKKNKLKIPPATAASRLFSLRSAPRPPNHCPYLRIGWSIL